MLLTEVNYELAGDFNNWMMHGFVVALNNSIGTDQSQLFVPIFVRC